MSTIPPPVGDGEFVFQRKSYPSFWSRLAKQKHGLGNMALSASCFFLAISIIKQDKELSLVSETAAQLRKQNEVLKEKLANIQSALVEDVTTDLPLTTRLRRLLDINASADSELSISSVEKTADTAQGSVDGKSSFMV